MKINQGSDLLIPKEQWVSADSIQGDEIKTLHSPVVEKAFKRVIELYKPKHKIALVSLCTTSRPYSRSRKWKRFKQHFDEKADLIICSNGGVIPIEFETCYPYMTYDAHGEGKWDRVYINICYRRLMEFFNKFEYDKIILNFRPGIRNRMAAQAFKRDYRGNSKIYILPSVEAYKQAQKEKFMPEGTMYPDISRAVLEEISKAINQ